MHPRNPESFLNNEERVEAGISEHEPALVDTKNSPLKKFLEKETKEVIDKALATLSPRQRDIIQSRLGFGGTAEQTLEEISKRYGVVPQRIGDIERMALKKLLKYLSESGFTSSSFGEIDDGEPYSVDRPFELESLYQQLIDIRQRINKGKLELLKKDAGDYSNPELNKLKLAFLDKGNLVIKELKKLLEQLEEQIKETQQKIDNAENAIKVQNAGVVELNSPVSVTYLKELQETQKKQDRRKEALEKMLTKISSKEFRNNI